MVFTKISTPYSRLQNSSDLHNLLGLIVNISNAHISELNAPLQVSVGTLWLWVLSVPPFGKQCCVACAGNCSGGNTILYQAKWCRYSHSCWLCCWGQRVVTLEKSIRCLQCFQPRAHSSPVLSVAEPLCPTQWRSDSVRLRVGHLTIATQRLRESRRGPNNFLYRQCFDQGLIAPTGCGKGSGYVLEKFVWVCLVGYEIIASCPYDDLAAVNIVAYRPVAKRWLCKQRPFLGNGWFNAFPRQRIRKQQQSYSLRSASCCVCLYFFILFCLNTATTETHSYSLCIISLLVSMVLLHVSTYEAITRQHTLTFIHKLFNCVLYEFIYYNITITNASNFLHI
jgi:hypothetical protein